MDSSVLAALAKWPGVPDVYGWLALDARGRWLLGGGTIGNPGIRDFIGRNYCADTRGAWYFQNGPQRVFAALECTPWILHLTGAGRIETHTGLAVQTPRQAWLDENGRLLIATELGMSLVCDRDLAALAENIRDAYGQPVGVDTVNQFLAGQAIRLQLNLMGRSVPMSPIKARDVPAIGGFIADPEPENENSLRSKK